MDGTYPAAIAWKPLIIFSGVLFHFALAFFNAVDKYATVGVRGFFDSICSQDFTKNLK